VSKSAKVVLESLVVVMAGLVPAIHVFGRKKQDVDARHKAGHDASRDRFGPLKS
jgi:hypothetical protein